MRMDPKKRKRKHGIIQPWQKVLIVILAFSVILGMSNVFMLPTNASDEQNGSEINCEINSFDETDNQEIETDEKNIEIDNQDIETNEENINLDNQDNEIDEQIIETDKQNSDKDNSGSTETVLEKQETKEEDRDFVLSAEKTNGIIVRLSGSESNLPYPADKLTLTAKKVDEPDVRVLLSGSEYENNVNTALDITLWHGDEEVQPVGDVKLSFEGVEDVTESGTKVLHIDSEDNEIEDMKTRTASGNLSVDTDHFSIYIVTIPTKTYTFYVDGKVAAKQIVKDGEELYRPEIPQKDHYKFVGWSEKPTPEEPYFEDFGKQKVDKKEDIKLYADFAPAYYVFFMQPDGKSSDKYTVYETKEGVKGDKIGTTLEDVYFHIDNTHNLIGWTTTKGGTDPVDEVTIDDKDIHLYPIIEDGNWIKYVTQTTDCYTKPQYFSKSEKTVAPEEPVRPGYTFQYWSETKDGPAFTFGTTISEPKTLYAVWKPELVNYTVIHWIENANYWDESDGEKGVMQPDVIDHEEYSFGSSEKKKGYSGATTAAAVDTSKYDSSLWIPQEIKQVVIDGHGDTIVNVYYKRKVFTINLQIGTKAEKNDNIIGGKQIYDVNGKPFTITAKWDAKVSHWWPDQRNEEFDFVIKTSDIELDNDFVKLKQYNAHNGTRAYKGLSKDVFGAGSMWQFETGPEYGWYDSCFSIMPAKNTNYYYLGQDPLCEVTFAFMVEPLPEETDDGTWVEFDGKYYKPHVYDTMCPDHPWWATTEHTDFEGFTYTNNLPDGAYLPMYMRNEQNAEYVDKGYITWSPSYGNPTKEISYYLYSRNKYDIHYFSQGNEINTIKGVLFERDISKTSYTPPEREGYTFVGWYSNQELAGEAYSFKGRIMPAKDITLYAKWVPNTVNVRFFDDITEDAQLVKQQKYDIGDGVKDDPEVTKDDYRFVCWLVKNDEGEFETYNLDTPLTHDTDLYPYYIKNTKYSVTYDLNNDYASKIVDEPIKGNPPADVHTGGYASGSYADVQLLRNVELPEGLVFLGWNTKPDGTGADYYPEEKILMEEDVTLYAIYGPESGTTCLTYHSNYNSDKEEETIDGISVLNNEEVKVLDNMFDNPGHRFIGWNTEPDGTGDWLEEGSTVTIDGERNDVYAIWGNGVILPCTGGYVITFYELAGILLTIAALVYAINRRRKNA